MTHIIYLQSTRGCGEEVFIALGISEQLKLSARVNETTL